MIIFFIQYTNKEYYRIPTKTAKHTLSQVENLVYLRYILWAKTFFEKMCHFFKAFKIHEVNTVKNCCSVKEEEEYHNSIFNDIITSLDVVLEQSICLVIQKLNHDKASFFRIC